MPDERVLRRPRDVGAGSRAARLAGVSLALFAGARTATSAVLLWLTTLTTAASEAGPHPSFAAISSVWDGRWYQQIALHGYPAALPLTASGAVRQNAWAFLPAYPWTSRAVGLVTGTDWAVAGVVTSLLFGAGAAVLLAVLLAPRVGDRQALVAVALFSFSPVSFMLQTTYPDAMMACLLFAALYLLERRRYLAAVPVVTVASFTRPGVLAFALACALHVVARRRELAGRPREAAGAAVLTVASGAGGLAWPVVAWLGTGRPDAYLQTEVAWRTPWTGQADFEPFTPWPFVAQQLFGPLGVPVLGLLVGLAAYALARPMRPLGGAIRVWTASWCVYLLAVFLPQTSLPRLLVPVAPALGAVPFRTRRAVIIAVSACTALQLLWLWCTYGPVKTFLTVP